ncbi:hypothetical protein [Nitrosopumilus sp.]|uniref:hypothetical protein n=1 Tax=Nitrosopumilus sp. TaxID=2024843 RepID=UPI00247CC96F|nr:hypothetical protein [Nitrosopumilus sp.]MCV0409366.1 hypothetical protein [Nitrosopumilus sp.]
MGNAITSFTDIFEYEKQSFEQRMQQGLLIDRGTLNLFHILPRIDFENYVDKTTCIQTYLKNHYIFLKLMLHYC